MYIYKWDGIEGHCGLDDMWRHYEQQSISISKSQKSWQLSFYEQILWLPVMRYNILCNFFHITLEKKMFFFIFIFWVWGGGEGGEEEEED